MAKVAVVTGATSGIGLEIARQLGAKGYEVALLARAPSRAQSAIDSFPDQAAVRPTAFMCDMSSLAQVRRAAGEIAGRHPRIDVLVNNAGVINMKRRVTEDGFEETFAVNHLAHFLLTGLLLDRLKAAASSRIINVASDAHKPFALDFDDLMSERNYATFRAYGRSKLANIHFTYELAQRLEGTGVTVNAVHPGAVASNFSKNNGGIAAFAMGLLRPFFMSSQDAAATPVWMATAPELEKLTGRYFYKLREIRSNAPSYEVDAAKDLWTRSEDLTGLRYPAA